MDGTELKAPLLKFHNKKTNVEPWAKELYRPLHKEDEQMATMHMKRGLASIVIREFQIKTTVEYH